MPATTYTLAIRASNFAHGAHAAVGQLRKYTGEPYIVHPAEVVDILRTVPGITPHQMAVGWLHDVVEDTGVGLGLIRELFGPEVEEGVEALTDVSVPSDGNRKARKAIDLMHTARAAPRWKTVKLADIISNSATIVAHDPKFARVWLPEKLALLDVLREGDRGLWHRARIVVDDAVAKTR
jgi:(p)ppGpp synthase/HD superfamily hydrolase